METLNDDCDAKQELNDSGLGQDETMPVKTQVSEIVHIGKAQLLDLSDDVLLYILKHCSPQDLKALGFSCPRLAALILDRTLWQKVDARNCPMGVNRMRWMLQNALCSATTHLMISGFAREASTCQSNRIDGSQENISKDESLKKTENSLKSNNSTVNVEPSTSGQSQGPRNGLNQGNDRFVIMDINDFLNNRHNNNADSESRPWFYPRMSTTPSWVSECGQSAFCEQHPQGSCPGPKFTFTFTLMRRLRLKCPSLHTLELEYCNIDCVRTGLSLLPRTLKKLSLCGSKCYNQPVDKSFLFKIQDYLTELEELDLSCCKWLEPSCLLPLSKMPSLKKLYMRRCPKMTEFVAYASLATRYGFSKLEVVDLRESPVGDSEVSSFGWVRALQELYVSPAPIDLLDNEDLPPTEAELEPWEEQEPDYFKNKNYDFSEVDEPPPMSYDNQKAKDLTKHRPGPPTDTKSSSSSAQKRNDDDDDDDEGPPAKRKKPCCCIIDTNINKSSRYTNNNDQNCENTPRVVNEALNLSSNNDTGNTATSNDGVAAIDIDQNVDRGIKCNPSAESVVVKKSINSGGESSKVTVKANPCAIGDASGSNNIGSNIIIIRTRPTNPNSSNVANISVKNNADASNNKTSSDSEKKKTCNPVDYSAVNDEAGPSRNNEISDQNNANVPNNSDSLPKSVLFRRNREPVVIYGRGVSNGEDRDRNLLNEDVGQNQDVSPVRVEQLIDNLANRDRLPMGNRLYVNFARLLHSTYTLSLPSEILNHQRAVFGDLHLGRVDPTSVVTDSAVYRFGRSHNEAPSFIQIGPNMPAPNSMTGMRPDRSNLRVLSLTGYRNVTNRSLIHLATAAPFLRRLDLSGTRVTRSGVDNFRSLRSDCEVIWSEIGEDS